MIIRITKRLAFTESVKPRGRKKKDHPAVKQALNRISHAANLREATKAYWRFSSRWAKTYPKAVDCLKKDFDQLLSFFQIQEL
jgi:transposase-like protein